ncbi:type II toxin-antitoxin system RelE/ParE family toxin [Halomonas piscis]|uniref:type II toxin-antitoxin system RelE/ParE family toxin n=1 Tax=Halomonas piscis TaxID=3031727 RepID=UPI002896D126|nr:type II toxin-antitoxin system RelE/ParE family toxin [Halomonas piscis]
MRLVWTLDAYHDRETIYDYIEAEDPIAALSLDMRFEEAAGHLVEHPQAGRLGRVQGTRELVAHRHYVLVYDLLEDTVRILRVLHTARQWPL